MNVDTVAVAFCILNVEQFCILVLLIHVWPSSVWYPLVHSHSQRAACDQLPLFHDPFHVICTVLGMYSELAGFPLCIHDTDFELLTHVELFSVWYPLAQLVNLYTVVHAVHVVPFAVDGVHGSYTPWLAWDDTL